jgi:hypothetical protein
LGGPGAGPAREPQGRKDTLRQREASEFTLRPAEQETAGSLINFAAAAKH